MHLFLVNVGVNNVLLSHVGMESKLSGFSPVL